MSENIPVTSNINIKSFGELGPPKDYLEKQPITADIAHTVASSRAEIQRVLDGEDDRFLVVVGPCSIHDEKAGLE